MLGRRRKEPAAEEPAKAPEKADEAEDDDDEEEDEGAEARPLQRLPDSRGQARAQVHGAHRHRGAAEEGEESGRRDAARRDG